MKAVVILGAIPHYFAARLSAVVKTGVDLSAITTRGSGDFPQFVYQPALAGLSITSVCGESPADSKRVLAGLLSSLRPDVVALSGWASRESFAAIAWARRANCPTVVFSESQRCDSARNYFRERIKARVVGMYDAALVGGNSHQAYLSSLGMEPRRIFFGYDAVDNEHFAHGADLARKRDSDLRGHLGLPRHYLIASARFIRKKNLTNLISAFSAVTNSIDDAPDLVILGDGPERGAIEKAVYTLGLRGKVHLMGFHDYEHLPALYGLAVGFIHISKYEQWGLVINEAAASGLPIIASSMCGATSELIFGGLNGFVVDPNNVQDIAHHILKLLHLPAGKRKSMGILSRRIVSNWGLGRFASGFRAACDCAVSQPRRTPSQIERVFLLGLEQMKISQVS